MSKIHTFHIPVMGIGFTVDTPMKVSQYGIDAVISIGDDILLEKLRKMYCARYKMPYEAITNKVGDFRAKRITSYLNLLNQLASRQFEKLKKNALTEAVYVRKYINMLPDASGIKKEFKDLLAKLPGKAQVRKWINENLSMGSIDVNIMTKLDRENYVGNKKLRTEYNDAHAALRGYANSELSSSVVFSAGMNPRLYSYMEQFDDFYPDENGELKKKIILKVSDYRSAFIQGKFLAKKGLWVSEYRIESGLNCGGHAFATDGYLLGPILAEFGNKKEELVQTMHGLYTEALAEKAHPLPPMTLPVRLTVQGGVGTSEEHRFLLDHYQMDSVGWGTPFLLVPEATTVDAITLKKLVAAKEDDLYLSNISPLGVPFHNLRNSTKGEEKAALAAKGKPGSPCVRKFLTFDKEFSEKPLCTASAKYQRLKIKALNNEGLSRDEYQKRYQQIVEKECLCTGLGASVLTVNELDTRLEGETVSICPGPNMAYFSKTMSLEEMTDHIYGRANVITRKDRPGMFMKELQLYIDYLKDKTDQAKRSGTKKQAKYLEKFAKNLDAGIDYYKELRDNIDGKFKDVVAQSANDLEDVRRVLNLLVMEIGKLSTGGVQNP